jgi:hypothetical protein
MKKIILVFLTLIILILINCSSFAESTPIENVIEHRKNINNELPDNKKKLFDEYKALFDTNDSINNSPYIYYYLSYLEDVKPPQKSFLSMGLEKFPDHPLLRHTKILKSSSNEPIKKTTKEQFRMMSEDDKIKFLEVDENELKRHEGLWRDIFLLNKFDKWNEENNPIFFKSFESKDIRELIEYKLLLKDYPMFKWSIYNVFLILNNKLYNNSQITENEKDETLSWLEPIIENYNKSQVGGEFKKVNLDDFNKFVDDDQEKSFSKSLTFYLNEIDLMNEKIKRIEGCKNARLDIRDRVKKSMNYNRNCVESYGPNVKKISDSSCRYVVDYGITNYCVTYMGFATKSTRVKEYYEYNYSTGKSERYDLVIETKNNYTGIWETDM